LVRRKSENKKESTHAKSWIHGAEEIWRSIDALHGKIYASMVGRDRATERKLRRKLFRTIARGIEHAPYRGRLLGAMGDSLRRRDAQIKWLLESFKVSRREGDRFSCAVSADSLAEIYEEAGDLRAARQWAERAKQNLRGFEDEHREIMNRANRLLRSGGPAPRLTRDGGLQRGGRRETNRGRKM
jgi:hypothetical protein